MHITENTTIADIASALPSSIRVFQRYDIDFCCGGKVSIADACRGRGLSFAAVAQAIEESAARPDPGDRDWTQAPLSTLVEHIVTTFHGPLREELPRIETMSAKVARVHGDKVPQLDRVDAIVSELAADLISHMRKEELVLFPAIAAIESGDRPSLPLSTPVAVMEHEHDRAGALLEELRAITNQYEVPSWACATFRALYQALAELEAAMHVHVHLENNVLFPRALALGDARGHVGRS